MESFSSAFMEVASIQPSYAKAKPTMALKKPGGVFGGIYIVKHLKCRSVFETGYRADDAHKYERNELYNGHADLKLACDLGA